PLPRPVRVLATLCAVALFAACANDPSSAATVGEGEISIDQLHGDVALFGFLTGLSGVPCGTPVGNETQEAACARFALANDIREELAKAYATENDLKVDAADVKGALTQLEQGLGGADALKSQLSDAGVTRAEVEAFAARLLLVNAVQQAVVEERLDEAALRDAYRANLAQFTTLEVGDILVPDKADAERIAAEVTPATFAKTAQRESIDQKSAAQGGSLGTFSEAQFQTQFDPDFVAAILALKPGEISGPVQTQSGWHVIHLVRRDVAPFGDVRDQLTANQTGAVFNDWFTEQLGTTNVEVNPRFGRFDHDTGEVLPIRSTAKEPAGGSGSTGSTGPPGSNAGS
ncbi:MAG TPA: peptidylprolyl isomerase, partial [Actinomycetota bacterium]|nr:peptidylprolyl isomerase [Actinomycetota bacterium]